MVTKARTGTVVNDKTAPKAETGCRNELKKDEENLKRKIDK